MNSSKRCLYYTRIRTADMSISVCHHGAASHRLCSPSSHFDTICFPCWCSAILRHHYSSHSNGRL